MDNNKSENAPKAKKSLGSGTANLEFRAESKEHQKVRAIEATTLRLCHRIINLYCKRKGRKIFLGPVHVLPLGQERVCPDWHFVMVQAHLVYY